MMTVYLHTGSNIGDRAKNLAEASALIAERIGKIIALSKLYETEAWGVRDQEDFYNQALAVETTLSPIELLKCTKQIEQDMGRKKERKWYKRLIDVDILFYGAEVVVEADLKIPHREMANRNFVLIPMLEIAPELKHPLLDKTIEEIYWESEDPLEVRLISTP
ncbi:MAG: 2-amino-4-hydroxy-6-hydroxymethyldihydropteridine diphosphokinase [Bacteroidota bacterium]